jgi:hypothetical protein
LIVLPIAAASCTGASRTPRNEPGPSPGVWSAPFDVSTVPAHGFTKVAIGDDGDAVFAWAAGGRIQTRSRSAAGELGPVVATSGPGAGVPRIAAAPGNGAVIAWLSSAPGGSRVQARTRSADGRLGPILAASRRGERASGPRVSVAANGAAVLAWTAVDAARRHPARITATTLRAGTLKQPVVVASLESGRGWRVATAADGTAVFVWERGQRTHRLVFARMLSASGLTPAVAVSAAGSRALLPQVAVAADGRALVAWTFSVPGASDNELDRVQARWLSNSGRTAGPIVDVSTRTPYPDPQVAIDELTGGVVVWTQTRAADGNQRVLTRALSHGGRLAPTIELAPGLHVNRAKLATAADGSATFSWLASDATYSDTRIQTRSRSADGVLGPLVTLASSVAGDVWPDADAYPQLAVGARGAAVVTWTHIAGQVATAQAAVRP